MLARLGFVAAVLSEDITTSRTCRLRNATRIRLRELIRENLDALGQVVSFLERKRIRLYRITSNLIPFASHPVNEVRWWDEFAGDLAAIGQRFRRAGVRVSTHPGQYTVLNAHDPAIAAAAVSELEYHARLLEAMGADASAKIVLHIGGLYGASEQAAMDRFCEAAASLPDAVLARLVVENDDRLFDIEEVLAVAWRVGVPVVFDWLHHHANPCRARLEDVLPAVFDTWRTIDGRPKIHLSTQAPDAPAGAHAPFVDVADALACFACLPDRAFDCMLEAKQKDRALLTLRADLRARGIVEADLAAGV